MVGLWIEAQASEVDEKGHPKRTLATVLRDPRQPAPTRALAPIAAALGIPIRPGRQSTATGTNAGAG